MELVLEQTQQGTSYEVSVSAKWVEELKRKVKIKGEKKEALFTLRQKPEHQSDTKVITMTMEILLEPTSNKLLVDPHGFEDSLKDGYEGTWFQLTQRFIATCSYSIDKSKDIMKAQNIKKDGYTRFQHQEQYEHVGPEVTRSQDDEKRLCLVDDLKEVQVHIQVKTIRTSLSLKS
ncbi:hypothetical protein Tco_0317481 [Tanacetum coccineum]